MGLDDLSSFNYWAVLYSGVPFSPDYTHSFYMPPINENNNQLDTFLRGYQINSSAIRGVGFRPNFDPAIKKRNTIRFMGDYKTFAQANYMMVEHEYKGETNYNFFCFIHQINILNNSVLEVEYEVDVLTTYLPYLTIGKSYILRETANLDVDVVNGNSMPEPLEVKSYVMSRRSVFYANRDFNPGYTQGVAGPYILIPHIPDEFSPVGYTYWSGFPTGYVYAAFELSLDGVSQAENFLESLSGNERQSIPNIYISPMRPLRGAKEIQVQVNTFFLSENVISTDKGAWVVRNKKILTSPFCYCRLWSTSGEESILETQLLGEGNRDMGLQINAVFNGASWDMSCVPHYGGNDYAYGKRVTFSGELVTSWSVDGFSQWLSQNGVSQALRALTSVTSMAAGVGLSMTGVGAGIGGALIAGGAIGAGTSALNTGIDFYQATKTPDNGFSQHTNSNLMRLMLERQCGFEWQYWVPSWDDCERIESYFDVYGYSRGVYDVPTLYGSPEGNYIQATNMELYGPAPGYAMQRIREIFARGVTFHDGPYLTRLKSGV